MAGILYPAGILDLVLFFKIWPNNKIDYSSEKDADNNIHNFMNPLKSLPTDIWLNPAINYASNG